MLDHLPIHILAGSVFTTLSAAPWAALLLIAIALCLWAALSDLTRFLIPNTASAGLVVGGVIWIATTGAPWVSHLIAFASVFVFGYAAYALRLLGAGDSKLLAALALWLGPFGAVVLMLHTTLIGAVLALAWILSGPARQALIGCGLAIDPIPPARIPYGIAISAAAIPALIGLWPTAQA